ncbi:MAG: CIA30 family protein [Acidimicrobiales bacterium]|nr:CIA30 family protein [Acidimicrobiales bacterium]
MPIEDQAPRQRLADFESDAGDRRWSVVDDDVMGGRSRGELSFAAGVLTFAGVTDTDGGGFSSVRLPMEPGTLSPFDRIELRARPDDRAYLLTFDDGSASGDRRVSHRAPIEFGTPGEWQTVSISFDDLVPVIFGRPIDDLPFRKELATRTGVLVSDAVDGAFRLEIAWIDLCSR